MKVFDDNQYTIYGQRRRRKNEVGMHIGLNVFGYFGATKDSDIDMDK